MDTKQDKIKNQRIPEKLNKMEKMDKQKNKQK